MSVIWTTATFLNMGVGSWRRAMRKVMARRNSNPPAVNRSKLLSQYIRMKTEAQAEQHRALVYRMGHNMKALEIILVITALSVALGLLFAPFVGFNKLPKG